MGQLDRATFGPHLRQLRHNAGLSQRIAAKHAGVSLNTWKAWEAGQLPQIPRAPAIARSLGTNLPDLLDPEPERVFVADLTITHAALERVRKLGAPELERIAQQVAEHARAKVNELAAAKAPLLDPKPPPLPRRVVASQARARMRARALARGYAS